MKKLPIILLIFSFACLNGLKAQTDFRPGFIITLQNDTVNGLIDYRGDLRNSRKCSFRINKDSEIKEYNPGEISSYRFAGSKYYVTKNVVVNDQTTKLFLEFLVNGIADLYFFKDGNNISHYLIEKEDGKIYELSNEDRIVQKEGRTYVYKSKAYIGILKYSFADCPEIYPDIEKSRFETKNLIQLTKKYNEIVCKNGEECIIYQKKETPSKVKIAPFTALNQSVMEISNNEKFDPAGYLSFGLLVNATLPKFNDKLSFQGYAEYCKSNFHGRDRDFQASFLKGRTNIKYTYPKGKLKPTAMAGFSMIYVIDKNEFSDETLNVLADILTGYSADIGFDYNLSTKWTFFFNAGYSYHFGGKNFPELFPQVRYTTIRSKSITIGLYF